MLQVGNGELNDYNADSIEIPPISIVSDNIIESVFNDPTVDITKRVILTPKNDASLLLNKQVLDRLQGEQRLYLSVDRVMCDDEKSNKIIHLNLLTV